MNKEQVHQYVLEHIGGSLKAREESKQLLGITFLVCLVAAVLILLFDSSLFGLSVSVLIAGIPLGVIAQRNTLRLALSRESLKLKRFLIGKKGYIAPKDHVLHENADLFSIAANLVCHEPFLSPQSAAGWQTFSVLSDTPGIATYVGWYGNDTKPSVFLYGDLRELSEISSDIWDLGHVRKLASSDKERFSATEKGWKRQQLLSVGLAFGSLPEKADPANISAKDIQDNCILLGALGLESTHGYQRTMPINPFSSVKQATQLQAIISLAIALLTSISVLSDRLFDIPAPVNILFVLACSVFIAPLLLAIFSWDVAAKYTPNYSAIWNAAVITTISYGTYLLYLYWQNALAAANGSLAHQTGTAITILTFGLCILISVCLNRLSKKRQLQLTLQNPLYVLAWTSSLLIVLIISYGSGPLLLGGLLLAIGSSTFYGLIHELRAYADRHHSRDHVLELLKTN